MKQNIMIISYDYNLSKVVAKELAGVFSMRFFDQMELFSFDNMPRTLDEILETMKIDYIYKKLKNIIKGELDYTDAVFVADISLADNCYELFHQIKLNNFVIMLKKDIDAEIVDLSLNDYDSKAEKIFFSTTKNQLEKRENYIAENLADIIIDTSGQSKNTITQNIVDKIKNYYSVN